MQLKPILEKYVDILIEAENTRSAKVEVLPTNDDFKFNKKNILMTFHPENLDRKRNVRNLKILLKS